MLKVSQDILEKTDTDSDGVDDDTFVQKTYPFGKLYLN